MLKQSILVFCVLWLSACSQPEQNIEKNAEISKENVLVKVDGQTITSDDLDTAITRTVGELAAFQLDESGREKVLQSLVLSKAMAITQTAMLSLEEKQEIERMVVAYREEILAKKYLKENISAVPVTESMVKEYYETHPEKFGGKTIRTFEVVKGLTKLEGSARDKMMTAMNQLETNKNWKSQVQTMKKDNLQVELSEGAVTQGVLKSNIDSILQSLSLNETSKLHFINGLPMIFRITKENKIAPKPLADVRSEIKKSLAPIQLKNAVKQVSDEILKKVKIEYISVKQ